MERHIWTQTDSPARILQLRDELYRTLRTYEGKRLKGDDLREIAKLVAPLLSPRIQVYTVFDSLQTLAGSLVTSDTLRQLVWRLAGNRPRLLQQPVLPWTRQAYPEWCPAQVTKVELYPRGRRREAGHAVTFQLLGGSACPMEIEQWWSNRKSLYLAYFKNDQGHGFGFQRPRRESQPGRPFGDATEFLTLRCLVLLLPELSLLNPGFKDIGFTGALADWNMEQQRYRSRQTVEYACPFDVPAAQPCRLCPIGQDRCRAATHPTTYVTQLCPTCKQRASFKPGALECVDCAEKSLFRSS